MGNQLINMTWDGDIATEEKDWNETLLAGLNEMGTRTTK